MRKHIKYIYVGSYVARWPSRFISRIALVTSDFFAATKACITNFLA